MTIALSVHLLATLVWVGGMFFAYMILRPSAGEIAIEARMPLWSRVFARFFLWVWLSVASLAASGVALVFLTNGGFTALSAPVSAMMALGLTMTAGFAFVYFVLWRRFRAAVSATAWQQAGQHLNQIRRLVGANLLLGIATVVVGVSGLYR